MRNCYKNRVAAQCVKTKKCIVLILYSLRLFVLLIKFFTKYLLIFYF